VFASAQSLRDSLAYCQPWVTAMANDSPPPAVIGPDHQLTAPRHRRRWSVIGCLVLAVVIGVWVLIARHRAALAAAATHKAPAGVSVTTVAAVTGSIGVYLDSIGTVTPVLTTSITSQVTGQIVAVHYGEGALVTRGAALIDIDPRPYEATLRQAQGLLLRDQGLLAQAEMDAARYRTAGARHAIARQLLEDQEKLVIEDQGTVENDLGLVEFDRLQVEYCHITAPIAGRMGLRLVDAGNVVQSGGAVTLAVITQLQPITVIFTIPENDLGAVLTRLAAGARLPVTAYDRSAQKPLASGTLITVDNQIDTTTGTVRARALFDNRGMTFYPNEFVNTRLLVDTLAGVVLVPTTAVQLNGQASFVYLVQGNVAHLHGVTTGVTDGGRTQVTGLNAGDLLANSGFDLLQDNAPVMIANSALPARPTPSVTAGAAH